MKKLFQNVRFIHGLYCAMLLIMSYLLWNIYPPSRECKLAEQNAKCLANSNEILGYYASSIHNELDDDRRAYNNQTMQKMIQCADSSMSIARKVIVTAKDLESKLRQEVMERENLCYHKYSTLPTRFILKRQDIDSLKATLKAFEKIVTLKNYNGEESKTMKENIQTLESQISWEDMNQLSVVAALAQLESIESVAYQINILILKELQSRYTSCGISFDKFGLGFYTNRASIKVGETFDAEIYTFNYASKLDKNYKISCDGKLLDIKDGVAHFEKTFYQTGQHSILATGAYTNPLTGQTQTYKKEYTFEVLPK